MVTRGDSDESKQRQEQVGQREWAEEVAAELKFESVGGRHALRHRHHTRVVDQHVDRSAIGPQTVGEGMHAGKIREVDAAHLERRIGYVPANLLDGRVALLLGAHGQHDVPARRGDPTRGLLAGPAVGARDDEAPTGLIADLIHGMSS